MVNKIKTAIRIALAAGAVAPKLLSGSASAASLWAPTYNYKNLNGTHLESRIITPDGTDQPYLIKERANNVKIIAPTTNAGGNLREFFWPANSPVAVDGMSCAVWSTQTDGLTQQGAALKIIDTPTSLRGITVTKNIIYGASWFFNVHLWDTTQPGLNQIGGFDMSEVTGKLVVNPDGSVGGDLKPFPWHLCARTIGNKLQFKVWTNEFPQPSWQDPKYTRELTLPTAWTLPGKTGWYIGHVRPGQSAEFQNLQTWSLTTLP